MINEKGASAIGVLHSLERFGSKLGLERIAALMALLGDPQDKMKCIHVAGTNGKGSVCRYIYSVLREHGYNTGIYTSPFVIDFYERIEYNGECITGDELEIYTARVMEQTEKMLAAGMDSPTEFEVLTAIAFLFYAEKGADFLVLEVGLGGSGDSTNIIKAPITSVITSISLDHTERLGMSAADIAAEKAGIIKTGCPVIMFVDEEGAAAVIAARAYDLKAPLIDVQKKQRGVTRRSTDGYEFWINIEGRAYNDIKLSMPGEHQVRNAACALCVIDLLRKKRLITTTAEGIRAGMRNARQPGRFEILKIGAAGLDEAAGCVEAAEHVEAVEHVEAAGCVEAAGILDKPAVEVVLDGAHNEAGAAVLADTVAELYPGEKVLVVMGVLKEKRLDAMLKHLDRIAGEYIATEPDNDRKLSAEQLGEKIKNNGKKCAVIADPREAAAAAIARGNEFGLIVIAGSLFLIGAVRRYLCEKAG
ncbi:MAG: bifunctional folylpolyglutamate synthase/dihydrofolate synthase [Clostridiales Family XIII bacterium]|jgi:dihydrofolate synthase/folylpolyglutamate synthase|nr:bifunctional folylpolyglutamate synthase/dihydrofolate synthase [Clostridiales Family XIII bacterium]